jgi:hypothetical protein
MFPIFSGFMIFGLFWLAAVGLWIYAIVEVTKVPDWRYRQVGSEKLVWVLIVILGGFIGALVFLIVKRGELIRGGVTAGATAPPGWYPYPWPGGGLRWWDGRVWAETNLVPPPLP